MISHFDFSFNFHLYRADLNTPLEIALPLREGGDNPNCYYAEDVKFETIRMGSFVGSVREGGPVNYQKIGFTPHGNGTHTECYGHIFDDENATLAKIHLPSFAVCHLISLEPQEGEKGKEISLENFQKKLPILEGNALAIRTLPNQPDKKTKKYSGTNPAFLSPELCAFLAKKNIEHLLVDLPSIDPEVDGGKLLAHKAFWFKDGVVRKDCSITELIYADNFIPDGLYLLNLQSILLDTDAAPSRPVLFPLQKLSYEPK